MATVSERQLAIGIDIGGTGIKLGLVDLVSGRPLFKRVRVLTPQPATPDAVIAAIAEALRALAERALEKGTISNADQLKELPMGVAFPGIVKDGEVSFCPNLDQSWIGENVATHIRAVTGFDCYVINDADAAGLAEMIWGAGREYRRSTVILTTLGTGIGSALFVSGRLLRNTELGHLQLNGREAEHQAAESVKVREDLSFETWAARLQEYFSLLELLFSPDAIIVGGGISKQHDAFLPLITTEAALLPAELRNDAGLVGAAYLGSNGGKVKLPKLAG